MRFCCLLPVFCAILFAGTDELRNLESAANVNSRYTVESVELTRMELARLSQPLRDRIASLVGARFDQQALEELGKRIRQELRHFLVAMRISRGSSPEQIRVIYELSRQREEVEITIPRAVYHSKQNFSFGLDSGVRLGDNMLRFGALTDNDMLVERFSGIRGGYERTGLAGDRLKVGISLASYRTQWADGVNEGTTTYRTRQAIEPTATIALSKPLTLQFGVGLERLDFQLPSVRDELASAAILTLRFQRRWQLPTGSTQELDASYGLRSGTRVLSSDFLYTRQRVGAQYRFRRGRGEILVTAEAGLLNGRAPLFERFVAGNSYSLRGWSKYELAPLGADRIATGTVDLRYRWLRLLYDTGSVWQSGTDAKLRHSAAVGVTSKGPTAISALVAFPIREGHISPMFITGINF